MVSLVRRLEQCHSFLTPFLGQAYPGLTGADLEAAWEYAAANLPEIDRAICENEASEQGFG